MPQCAPRHLRLKQQVKRSLGHQPYASIHCKQKLLQSAQKTPQCAPSEQQAWQLSQGHPSMHSHRGPCRRSFRIRQRQRQRCSLQRQRQRWPIAAPADRYRRLLQPRLHVMAAILHRRHLLATISHSAAMADGTGGSRGTGDGRGWMMSPSLSIGIGSEKNISLQDGEVIPSVQRVRSGRGDPTRALRA